MGFDDHIKQGIEFYEKNKFKLALEQFEKAGKIQPDNTAIKENIEKLKEMVYYKEQAAQSFIRDAKNRAGSLGINLEDIDKVIEEYRDAHKRNINDDSIKKRLAEAHFIRGHIFTAQEEQEKALEDYNEAVKNNPDDLLALKNRGHANCDTGNYSQAINDYKKIYQYVCANPDRVDEETVVGAKSNLVRAYESRGMASYDKGEYKDAIVDFEEILKYEQDDRIRELLEAAKREMAKGK